MKNLVVNFRKEPRENGKVQFDAFDVGSIEVQFEASITIDSFEVDDVGVGYIIGYGIKQALADCYAALTDAEKAREAFQTKLRAMIAGELEFGASNRTADPVEKLAKQMALDAICKQLKMSESALRKQYGKQVSGLVAKVLDTNGELLRTKARAIVEAAKADSDSLDLSALTEAPTPAEVVQPAVAETAAPVVEPKAAVQPKVAKKARKAA